MKNNVISFYEKWLKLYGTAIPYNLISVQRMLLRWKITSLNEIEERFVNDKKLGPYTFNDRHAIFKRFFKWCIKHGYAKTNPFDDIPRRKISEPNPKREPYQDEEILAILKALHDCPHTRKYYYPFVKFMFLTGTRNGEALGLKVKNINFERRFIHIEKSYSRQITGKKILKSTKTSKGNRYIPLSDELRELLEPICAKKTLEEFVFTTRDGTPINDHNFQLRIFKPLLKDLKIPERVLYACRHTFGTIAVEQNIDILSVAYLMGHSKPRTVLDHYAVRPRKKPEILPSLKTKFN